MTLNIKKFGLMAGLVLMITSICGKCMAYPLPTHDMKRIGSSVQVGMQQVTQIKQEIESNMHIIQEIQNGGYAAAAGDLFAKVQNGDYDRFGNNLKGLKDSSYAATHSAQAVEERKIKQQAERERKEKENLEKNAKAAEKGAEVAAETHKKANESFFGRAYNWVKNNRSVTGSALNAVDAAKNNNLSGILEQGSISAGGIVGGTNGSDISSLGGVVSAGVDIVNGSGNIGEAITNTAVNGKLSGNLDNLDASHAEREAALKQAGEEAAEKQKKDFKEWAEKAKQEAKQKMCSDCRADAVKNGRNAETSCLSACSF